MLTEEQNQELDELFYKIIDDFITEGYNVDPSYEMTVDDYAITEAVKEYFKSNFKFPTIQEAVVEAVTSYDINTPLYEELSLILMDEGIGKFVAGAKYGIKQALASYNKNAAKSSYRKAKSEKERLGAVVKSTSNPETDYQKAKAARIQMRAAKAKESAANALKNKQSKEAKYGNIVGRRGQMEKDVDAAIEAKKQAIKAKAIDIKDKTKQAIKTGVSKVSGFFGDLAGRFA